MLLRSIFISLVCGALALGLGVEVARALRTGVIRHSDSTSLIKRSEAPVRFWCLALLFSSIVAMCVDTLLLMIRQMLA